MFEDDEIDVPCPKCGHRNPIPVRQLGEHAETHFVCESCKTGVKVESAEFSKRLHDVEKDLADLERQASREGERPLRKTGKGDYRI